MLGAGTARFFNWPGRRGWSVRGVDFDAIAVSVARSAGLDVQHGGLEVLEAAEPRSFGWVNFSHVLEHVHDPVRWLQALHRVTEPGGTLCLQTPNIGSIGHARYGENWRDLDPPRHLTLWTLDTLCQTLKRVGFRNVRPLRTPVFTAMEVYATSEGLQRGMDYAGCAALTGTQRRRARYLWPALRQYWSVRRSEFHTLLAIR